MNLNYRKKIFEKYVVNKITMAILWDCDRDSAELGEIAPGISLKSSIERQKMFVSSSSS